MGLQKKEVSIFELLYVVSSNNQNLLFVIQFIYFSSHLVSNKIFKSFIFNLTHLHLLSSTGGKKMPFFFLGFVF